MSTREYILNQVELIKRDCAKLKITPEEWVSRFAKKYHDEHALQVVVA
ncbi:MAG: hypothetical protein HYS08_09105 [Chlamydiae bacterium]|nr:hypothetical protein [Chlamydiota bacterium]MBI3265520.1 hypothetical protein [Chlamydiota bacterium]